jgi:hypothetical protein
MLYGAGRFWMETKKGERFSELRIEKALDIGANTVAIRCPYCMANFSDGILSINKEDVIEIKDIAELVSDMFTIADRYIEFTNETFIFSTENKPKGGIK